MMKKKQKGPYDDIFKMLGVMLVVFSTGAIVLFEVCSYSLFNWMFKL